MKRILLLTMFLLLGMVAQRADAQCVVAFDMEAVKDGDLEDGNIRPSTKPSDASCVAVSNLGQTGISQSTNKTKSGEPVAQGSQAICTGSWANSGKSIFFTVTVKPGKKANFTAFCFQHEAPTDTYAGGPPKKPNDYPQNFVATVYRNGVSVGSASGSTTRNWQSTTVNISNGNVDGSQTADVVFRVELIASNAFNSTGTKSIWELDDFCLKGSVDCSSTPSTCSITGAGASVKCKDAGTPTSDQTSDDYYELTLNPTGTGSLGTKYKYTVTGLKGGGSATGTGTWGSSKKLSDKFAVSSTLNITIENDNSTGGVTCTAPFSIATGASCSTGNPPTPTCSIDNLNGSTSACNPNVVSDPNDDYFTLTIRPTSTNPGASNQYRYSISPGGITGTGTYNVSQTLTNQFSMGSNLTVVITDFDNASCTKSFSVSKPSACPPPPVCKISSFSISTTCKTGASPSSTTDDYQEITIKTNGTSGQAFTYTVRSSGVTVTSGTGTIGTDVVIGSSPLLDPNTVYSISVDDNDATTTCSLSPKNTTPPGTCSSPTCRVYDPGIAYSQCNDNGTNTNPADDYYTITLNPTAVNITGNYTYTIMPGNITGTGTYGTPRALTDRFLAGASLKITIISSNDLTCMLKDSPFTIPSTTCSVPPNVCAILKVNAYSQCYDNGTETAADDYYKVTITSLTASNTSGTYKYTVRAKDAGGTVLMTGTATGGTPFTLTDQFPANTTPEIDVEDASAATCNLNGTRLAFVPPCSTPTGECKISLQGGSACASTTTFTVSFTVVGTGGPFNYVITQNGATVGSGTHTGDGSQVTSAALPIANGAATVTVSHPTNTACSVILPIPMPTNCNPPPVCGISADVSIGCNKGTMPYNSADDYAEITIRAVGTGLSTPNVRYTVKNAVTGAIITTGLMPQNVSYILPYHFPVNTNMTLSLEDETNASCQGWRNVAIGGCFITVTPCSLQVQVPTVCNGKSTSVTTDDEFTIKLLVNAAGDNSGYYKYVINPGNITGTANYGTITPITTLFPLSANVTVTVTDGTIATCTQTINVAAPAPCSPACSINTSGVITTCNDNATGSNASDDYFTVQLNPTSSNSTTTYRYLIMPGNITGTGTFGTAQTLSNQFPVGTDLTLTITDNTDASCTRSWPIRSTKACSCGITNPTLTATACNNPGNDPDGSNDRIQFSLNPKGVGFNAGDFYTVTAMRGATAVVVSPAIGTYGIATTFQLPAGSAGAGDVVLTITDNLKPTCNTTVTLKDPGPCSVACPATTYPICKGETYTATVTEAGATNIQWFKDIGAGPVAIAGATNLTLTVSDIGKYTYTGKTSTGGDLKLCCPIVVIKGPCPLECRLTAPVVTEVRCNPRAVNPSPSTDYITFKLNPTGTSLAAAGYTVTVDFGTITPTTAPYGVATLFTLQNGSAGSGNVTVTIKDVADPTDCFLETTITDPGTCTGQTPVCNLQNINLGAVQCDNNGTGINSDDRISFALNPTGTNLSANYTVTVSSGSVTPTSAPYGVATVFRLQAGSAGAGNVTITVKDAVNSCQIQAPITDPGSCSSTCVIDASATTLCEDQSTGTTIDDRFAVTLSIPVGAGTGASYNYTLKSQNPANTPVTGTGTYGANVPVATRFLVGEGDLSLDVRDAADVNCLKLNIPILAPDFCSECQISIAKVIMECHNNNTAIPTDDYYTVKVLVNGNSGGTLYDIFGDITATGLTYGQEVQIGGNIPYNSGIKHIIIRDRNLSTCQLERDFQIPTTSCSNCDIVDLDITTICDNKSTSSLTDDTFTFTTNPVSNFKGPTYTVKKSDGTILRANVPYGSAQTIGGPYNISAGNFAIFVQDDSNPGCIREDTVYVPTQYTSLGAKSVVCLTPTSLSLTLNPTGSNIRVGSRKVGEMFPNYYKVSVSNGTITPTVALYGVDTPFQIVSNTSIAGFVTISIIDSVYVNSCPYQEDVAILTPTFSAEAIPATCTGASASSNGMLKINTVSNADKVGYSLGATYTGAAYATATAIPTNGILVSNLTNPATATQYTIRVFNGNNTCFYDQTVTLLPKTCPEPPTCINKPEFSVTGVQATCSAGTALSNAKIVISGLTLGDKVGYSLGATYTGAAYASAVAIPANGLVASNLANPATVQQYTVRVFNGANDCYTDHVLTLQPKVCIVNPLCPVEPVFTATAKSSTCTGTTPNNDGSLSISGISSADKVGYSIGVTYTGPAYATATAIVGTSMTLLSNIANPASPVTYTVRVFNTSANCYTDQSVTIFPNCINLCILPTFSGGAVQPTCVNGVVQNNGKLIISHVNNGTKVGYSLGATYTGPAFATAPIIPANGDILTNITNPASATQYTIRVFNGANCYYDQTVTLLPRTTCPDANCVSPVFVGSAIQATCAAGTPQSNAKLVISGVGFRADKVGYSLGASYTGPAYASAFAIPADGVVASGLANPATVTQYTIRVFKGSNNCFEDQVVTLQPKMCNPNCPTEPVFTAVGKNATCTNGVAANDAKISISGLSNGTRVGIFLGMPYNGVAYAGATTISGSSMDLVININNPTATVAYTIRVFNGSDGCYIDQTATITPQNCNCGTQQCGSIGVQRVR